LLERLPRNSVVDGEIVIATEYTARLGRQVPSETRLFRPAYAFEQGTLFRRCPASTPALPGERFEYSSD